MTGAGIITCLNGGVAQSVPSSTGTLQLGCRCPEGFTGAACELRITSGEEEESTFQTVWNICLCVFLLVLLPSIVLYALRTVYLVLKRCGAIDPGPKRNVTVQVLARPRPAFRTISLPVTATLLVSEPLVLEDVRRIHRTHSWQPRTSASVPAPPPPYNASLLDKV